MSDFIHAIAEMPLSVFLREVSFIIPAIQTIHILAISILGGSFLMVAIAIVRPAGARPASAVAAQFFPWIFGSLLVLLLSGSVLILAEPARTLANVTFWIKMGLVAAALPCLTALRRRALTGNTAASPQGAPLHRGGTLPASAAILVVAIIFAGRWIAYTEPLIQ